eukprot:1195765-Prorocentrum_minimum.AAC.3
MEESEVMLTTVSLIVDRSMVTVGETKVPQGEYDCGEYHRCLHISTPVTRPVSGANSAGGTTCLD